MSAKTFLTGVFLLTCTSCSDTQVAGDMSSDMDTEMSKDMALDVSRDATTDLVEDMTEDVAMDLSHDMAPDSTSDMKDASADFPEDMLPDALSPAHRRMCIEEDNLRCKTQQKTQFGDCGEVIGAVFNGQQCVEATGCPGCQGDDCPMFDSIDSCATSCAQNGWCQVDKMPLLSVPQCIQIGCEEPLVTCVSSNTDPTNQFKPLGRGDVKAVCLEKDANAFCRKSQVACTDEGQWCCHYRREYSNLNSDELTQVCALTLQPNIQQVGCLFFSE